MRSICDVRVLVAFEQAERESDRGRQRRLLTFVVIGGGPTGVELAGALAEISRHALASDFRAIDPESARIILIEGGPAPAGELSGHPVGVRAYGARAARRGGLDGQRGHRCGGGARARRRRDHRSGDRCSGPPGVAASPLGATLGVPLDRAGRVLVGDDLTLPGRPEISVVGDLAALRARRRHVAARCGAGRDPAGRARRGQHPSRPGRRAPPAVRLSQSGEPGDHRPPLGRRGPAAAPHEGAIPPGCSGCSCTCSS